MKKGVFISGEAKGGRTSFITAALEERTKVIQLVEEIHLISKQPTIDIYSRAMKMVVQEPKTAVEALQEMLEEARKGLEE